jgi:GH18 family chitinase
MIQVKSLVAVLVFAIGLKFVESRERTSPEFLRTCYYSIPDAQDESSLQVKMLDGSICTHIILGFAKIDTTNLTIAPTRPEDLLVYQELLSWGRAYHPNLKIMLSIGGGDADSGFHEACLTQNSRSKLIESIIQMLHEFDFDGLDIDWEFPGWSKHDMDPDNFVSLLYELRKAFSDHSSESKRKATLLLSVAVSASQNIITVSYNATAINDTVDFVNLMTYDFHDYSTMFPFVGFNAPLYKRSGEEGFLSTLNVYWAASYWNDIGVGKDKIMIGIPTYTHNYRLSSTKFVAVGSPAVGREPEFTYFQICDFLSNVSTTSYVFDQEAKVPYAFNTDLLWSSFEDTKSVYFKAAFIRDQGYGGSMIFNLNSDDYSFKCSLSKRFVLSNLVKDVLTRKVY